MECVQLAAAFSPASSLAGTRGCREGMRIQTEAGVEIPARELAGRKAAASCTHSKASLRGEGRGRVGGMERPRCREEFPQASLRKGKRQRAAKASLRMPMGGVFPQPVRPRPAVRNAGERPLMDFFHRQKKCQRFVVNDNSFHVASFPLDKANSRAILDAEASTRWRTRKAADLYKGPAQSIPKGRCQVPGVRCQGSGKTLGPSHVTRIASPPLAPDT